MCPRDTSGHLPYFEVKMNKDVTNLLQLVTVYMHWLIEELWQLQDEQINP